MILVKAGKSSFKLLVLFFFLIGGLFFGFPQKAKATDQINYQGVVINELIWMGSSASTADEWLELKNLTGQAIDISGWKINGAAPSGGTLTVPTGKTILANGFFLISNYDQAKTSSKLNVNSDWVTTSVSLPNSNAQYVLKDVSDYIIDMADDGSGTPLAGDNTAKYSMERNFIPGDGTLKENWHTAVSSAGFDTGASEKGTPGSENSSVAIITPKLISPANGAVIIGDTSFDFEWDEENDLNYKLVVSKNLDLSDPIADIGKLDWGKYYWGVIVSNDRSFKVTTPAWSFELKELIYSKDIIINEFLPHPADGTDNEFIELYNADSGEVDLSGWFLDDIDGGSSPYQIPNGTKILSGQYLIFLRSQTGIALNDSGGDISRLFNPNNELVSSVSYSDYASLGLAWAKGADGNWSWTDMPTAGAENIIHLESSSTTTNSNDDQPLNSEPIEISTGDFQNYLNYLVQITGEVTETSGDTFYLDDGTGEVKIYIQSKTGIDKPEMHKGDIFQIVGIVDLYGKTWRILPRTLDDIKLIDRVLTVSLAAKKTTKSKIVAKSVLAKVASSNNPSVLAASATKSSAANNGSNSFWLQFLETAMGIAAILLIYLIFQISRQKKEKISRQIGGRFGQDDT